MQWEDRAGSSPTAEASQGPWEPGFGGGQEASLRPESGTVGWGFGHFLGLQQGKAVLGKEATQLGPLHASLPPHTFLMVSQ